MLITITFISFNFLLLMGEVVVIYMFKIYMKRKSRMDSFEYYDSIMIVFDRAREMAYNKIFRDYAMTELSSGYKLGNKDSQILQKKYIEITFVYSGPDIIDNLILIHGNLDAITAFLASDLMKRLGDDEVTMREYSAQTKGNM